jgi:hypothetical protein
VYLVLLCTVSDSGDSLSLSLSFSLGGLTSLAQKGRHRFLVSLELL